MMTLILSSYPEIQKLNANDPHAVSFYRAHQMSPHWQRLRKTGRDNQWVNWT